MEGQMSLFDEFGNAAPDRRSGETIHAQEEEGIKSLKRLAKRRQPPKDPTLYWMAASSLLEAWIEHVKIQKLFANWEDPDRHHKVEYVVDHYYDGEGGLKRKKDSSLREFINAHDYYNWICSRYWVETTNRSWFYTHLWEQPEYDSFRRRVKTRMRQPDKYPPVALKDFPPRKPKK